VVSGLVAACVARVDMLPLEPMPRPATDTSAVQFLVTEPDRPYIGIAFISVSTAFQGLVRSSLIKKAARLGGHAVVVDANSFSRAKGGPYRLSGKVIVFRDEPTSP
jgi:hypothetical protein